MGFNAVTVVWEQTIQGQHDFLPCFFEKRTCWNPLVKLELDRFLTCELRVKCLICLCSEAPSCACLRLKEGYKVEDFNLLKRFFIELWG